MKQQHRWLNVVSEVEVMIEVDVDNPVVNEKMIVEHLDKGNWKHVRIVRTVADRIETY